MEKKITQEFLKELGIYELRELARQVGVESPTTKKRAELCEHILKISSGEMQPTTTNSNKGRPPKSVSRVLGIAQEVFPKGLLNLKSQTKQNEFCYSNILKFSQSQFTDFNRKDEHFVQGYIKIYQGKYYVLNHEIYPFNSTKVIFVPDNFIDELSLREGDKIEGIANPVKDDEECGTLSQINFVNDKEIANHLAIRKNLDINLAQKTSEKINILGNEIYKGSRILFNSQNPQLATEMLVDMVDNDESKTKYIFVGAELSPENLFFFQSRQKIDKFMTGYGQELQLISQNINNAIKYAETLLRDGNKINFVIFDLYGLLNSLDMYYASEPCGEFHNHKVNTILHIKKLVGLGRAISEDAFINTISVVFEKDKDKTFVKDELDSIITEEIDK